MARATSSHEDQLQVTTFAGFWVRVGAAFIDLALFGVWAGLLTGMYGRYLPEDLSIGGLAIRTVAIFGLFWTYYVLMTKLAGGTLGKKALRLEVRTLDLGPPDWPTVLFREVVGRILVMAAFFLGYLWVGVDKRKQGWHDKIADTVVVRLMNAVALRSEDAPPEAGGQSRDGSERLVRQTDATSEPSNLS